MSGERTLIKNARLWPAVDEPVIEDGALLVRDGRIEKMGRRIAVRAERVVDADGCLVMPGFIHTHIHLCQTLFRGVAEDLPLLPWLQRFIWPLEANHDDDSLAASVRLAAAELLRTGATGFLSMETVHRTDVVFETAAEIGLHGIVSHCLMDETGGYKPLATDVDESLGDCDVLLKHQSDWPDLQLAVAPRFALSCSAGNLRVAADYARDRKLLLHTHCGEQLPEVDLVRKLTGKPNFEFLHSVGLSGTDVCLAHCVHLTPEEMRLLRATDTRVLHCPSANMKLGSGIAPVKEYLADGVTVSLGADGAACNNRLDMFAEMRGAGLLQKLRHGPDALPAREIVRMATTNGARTLGWEKECGTLAPGKRADLIFVRLDHAHTLPADDPATALVYSCAGEDVALTMVGGRILYQEGRLTSLDEERLRRDARAERKKLMRRAGLA